MKKIERIVNRMGNVGVANLATPTNSKVFGNFLLTNRSVAWTCAPPDHHLQIVYTRNRREKNAADAFQFDDIVI